jgi:hypothetical protein
MIFDDEMAQLQNDISELERQLQATIFADPDFDPETWLEERGL